MLWIENVMNTKSKYSSHGVSRVFVQSIFCEVLIVQFEIRNSKNFLLSRKLFVDRMSS